MKQFTRMLTRTAPLTALVAASCLAMAGCSEDEPDDALEEAAESVEDVTDDVADGVEDAADEVSDAVDDVVDDAEDAVEGGG